MAEKMNFPEGATVFECQDCGMFMSEQEMIPLSEMKNLLERMSSGEIMPFGECWGCGAMVHIATASPRVTTLAYKIFRVLQDCSGRSLDDEGDRAVTAMILAGALERS